MTDVSREIVDTRVLVETPEGVDFRFVIAGPGKRGVAWLCDLLLKIGIAVIVVIFSCMISVVNTLAGNLSFGGILFLIFVLNWFYAGLFEGFWKGRTPGKMLLNLRVVRSNGTPLQLHEAIGRNFLAGVDVFPGTYLAGVCCMLFSRRMQRIGDLVFDTMVIDEEREHIGRAVGVTHGVDPIARSECSGRWNVPERTLAVVERLFEGDRVMSPGRREEIAKPLSIALRGRLGFQDPLDRPDQVFRFANPVPQRHTFFLRRVLRTFADVREGPAQAAAARSSPIARAAAVERTRNSGRRQPAGSSMSLDTIIAEFLSEQRAESPHRGSVISEQTRGAMNTNDSEQAMDREHRGGEGTAP